MAPPRPEACCRQPAGSWLPLMSACLRRRRRRRLQLASCTGGDANGSVTTTTTTTISGWQSICQHAPATMTTTTAKHNRLRLSSWRSLFLGEAAERRKLRISCGGVKSALSGGAQIDCRQGARYQRNNNRLSAHIVTPAKSTHINVRAISEFGALIVCLFSVGRVYASASLHSNCCCRKIGEQSSASARDWHEDEEEDEEANIGRQQCERGAWKPQKERRWWSATRGAFPEE